MGPTSLGEERVQITVLLSKVQTLLNHKCHRRGNDYRTLSTFFFSLQSFCGCQVKKEPIKKETETRVNWIL